MISCRSAGVKVFLRAAAASMILLTGFRPVFAAPAASFQTKDVRGGVVLVLSGGGTKGFAHVGVLKVLERERIPIAGIVGVSMGAIIGGLYACGYTADEIRGIIEETNVMGLLADSGTRIKPDAGSHRPVGETVRPYHLNFDKDMKLNGPLGFLPALSLASFLTKYTGHVQTSDFDDLPIPFACVAADLGTGEEVVLRSGNLASSIRASASIPGLLEPWPIDGRLLVDGGLVANVPVAVAKEIFPDYPVIAVNLAGESIAKPNERFRSMLDVMMQTIDIMTLDRIKLNESLADLVLYPDLSMYSMLGSSGYGDIYDKGVQAADANIGRIAEISASAPPPLPSGKNVGSFRIVRSVRVSGLHASLASELEESCRAWVGNPYDAGAVNEALERIAKLDEVAVVDVDIDKTAGGGPDDIDVVFSVEKRPAFEIELDGYTSNLHAHRGMALGINARDLSSYGDSANLDIWLGDEEYSAYARYFTPLLKGGQWGFSLGARRERFEPENFGEYSQARYSGRALYYLERTGNVRFGMGAAGEYADMGASDRFSWGPYFYFNRDTLDNLLIPSKGYSFNSQIWWNDSDILVSRTSLVAYIPWRTDLRFLLSFGLETGEKDHQAYRVLLGDKEELFSAARRPMAGDQFTWARVGLGKDFYNSWWGAVRGEIFASYGMVMDDWDRADDAWEAGVLLSLPGQILSGRVILVYSGAGELVFGFSLGSPRWTAAPLP
ncbi:MAG: patatin-like phospholipase family protein [Synergistaceae bacterium]|jgi:NTE family protein|nr:patatin-like phospholipase family protein [Synergistaceae bacterium]